MSKRFLYVAVLFLVCCSSFGFAVDTAKAASSAADTAKPTYTIEAIRYATIKDWPVAGLVVGADKSRKIDIAMVVWLIRGNGHNILFDSGFYRPQFFKRYTTNGIDRIVDYQKPSDAVLNATGLKPGEITDIVISHAHWDHMDGFDLFPNAHIWIQRDEYTYYIGEAWQQARVRDGHRSTAIDPDDAMALVNANMEGKVSFVEGDAQEFMPGITAYIGGKHTYASQYIGVNAKDGTVVLASDNVYMYENLDKHVPIAESLDPVSNLAAQDRMRKIASKPEFIIPGHDPAQFQRFPAVGSIQIAGSPGVVKID